MKDLIIQGMICNRRIRFCAISGKEMISAARKTHGLSRVATAALGRQLLVTSMIASQMKNVTDTVTTAISGNGPAGSLVCVGRYGGLVKGYAQNPLEELPLRSDGKLDVSGYIGRTGKLSVIRDLGLKEPYVGMCNLISGEVAEDFAQYFAASEQQPSLVYLGVREQADTGNVLAAGGILIQPMPDTPESDILRVEDRAEEIARLTQLLSDGTDLEESVRNLIGIPDLEITERIEPAFRCDCSRERLERALLTVGEEELLDILNHEGETDLTCQFCLKQYHFSRADIEELLKSARIESIDGE